MAPLFSKSYAHRYAWSGLHVKSKVVLPELIGTLALESSEAAVRIEGRYANPGTERTALSAESWLDARHGQLELHLQGVATVSVRHDHISVLAHPQAPPREIQSLICTTALAGLAQVRKMMALQASAVATPRGAALFVGPAKSGKTSLATCMSCLGAPLIADDPCMLWLDGERVLTAPSIAAPRPVASEIAAFMPPGSTPARPISARAGFEHRVVSNIFILSQEPTAETTGASEMTPADAIAGLSRNLFRPDMIERMGQGPLSFRRAAQIVDRVNFWRLSLPQEASQIPTVARELLRMVSGAPSQKQTAPTIPFLAPMPRAS